MNESRKLALSKETLRCLDDQDLTDVVGGGGDCKGNGGGGGGNNQSFAVVGCISNNCFNASNGVCSGICL
jgi:natural product precursor